MIRYETQPRDALLLHQPAQFIRRIPVQRVEHDDAREAVAMRERRIDRIAIVALIDEIGLRQGRLGD